MLQVRAFVPPWICLRFMGPIYSNTPGSLEAAEKEGTRDRGGRETDTATRHATIKGDRKEGR